MILEQNGQAARDVDGAQLCLNGVGDKLSESMKKKRFVASVSTIQEEGEKRVFRSRKRISEGNSGSHSHSSQSHSSGEPFYNPLAHLSSNSSHGNDRESSAEDMYS